MGYAVLVDDLGFGFPTFPQFQRMLRVYEQELMQPRVSVAVTPPPSPPVADMTPLLKRERVLRVPHAMPAPMPHCLVQGAYRINAQGDTFMYRCAWCLNHFNAPEDARDVECRKAWR